MITLVATIRVREGKMDEAVAVLRRVIPEMRKNEPGCLAYIPHRVQGDLQTIVFYEKYADENAAKIHAGNLPSTMRDFFPLLEPGMELKTCMEIPL